MRLNARARKVPGPIESAPALYAAYEVSSLESQLRGNLSEWIGSAQQAYHEAQAQWNAAMADMQQVLSQLGAVIGTANNNYQSAEAANTGLWS